MKCSIAVAKKHMGPQVKTKEPETIQCHSHSLKKKEKGEKKKNKLLQRKGADWQLCGGVLERKTQHSDTHVHTAPPFSFVFLFEWSETST